jgi:hypothetical protein
VAQFEKAMLVAKLKGARDRKRRSTGKKGRRPRKPSESPSRGRGAGPVDCWPGGKRPLSLREISAELGSTLPFEHPGYRFRGVWSTVGVEMAGSGAR